MSAAHTSGAWYVTECDDFIRVRQESSDAVLATIEDGTHPELELVPWAEQQANAHLIAAAPELIEDGIALLGLLCDVAPAYAESTVAANFRAAIAKARGEA